MTDIAVLNHAEQVALEECERVIDGGLKQFVAVGSALAFVRENRLYRGSHETFESYARERWNLSRPRAYELMTAAEVVSAMADTEQPPANERQARELAKVPEPERAEVWRETVERTEGKPTAAAVRETVERTQTPPSDPGKSSDPVAAVAAALDKHVPDPGGPERAWRKAFYDQHVAASKFLSWLDVEDYVRFADDQDLETLRLYASMISDFYRKVTVQLGSNVVTLRSVQ